MQTEEGGSPPRGGKESQGDEDASKTVYFVPIYAVAIVDPNKQVAKSRASPEVEVQKGACRQNDGAGQLVRPSKCIKRQAAENESNFQHKRQKLIVMRKRGRIPDYDDDDPHKPTPKRLRNRMKAQKSRDKKKAYMSALENKVNELLKINSELEDRCNALRIENELLKNEIPDVDPLAQHKPMHRRPREEEDHHTLKGSLENQANLIAERLNDNADRPSTRCPRRSHRQQAEIYEMPAESHHHCSLDKFMCGSNTEASPSRYIDSDAQDNHHDNNDNDDVRHDLYNPEST